MESLVANFIEFFRAITKFLFLQGRLNTKSCLLLVSYFPIFFLFPKPLRRSAARKLIRTLSLK